MLDDKEEIERYYGLEVETISAVSLPQGDIHSGKAVVILTFDKGKLVFKPREMEQEKNNMYVAVTRAKRLCYLSYPRSKKMPWGDNKRQTPSRFLKDIDILDS